MTTMAHRFRSLARTLLQLRQSCASVTTGDLNASTNPHNSSTCIVIVAGLVAASLGSFRSNAASSASAESTPKPDSQNTGTAQWRVFTDVARDLARQGRTEEAEKYLVKAVEAAKKGFGDRDPHVASACQNLAEIYRLQRRYDLAAPLYDEALGILAEEYGPRDIRVAFALHNFAGFHFGQGDYETAAHYYEQALQVKLAAVGPGHSETSNTLFHLAEVRWAQGKKQEGIRLVRLSLNGLELQGASDEACARRRTRLAEMLLTQNEYKEAEPLLRKVLEGSGPQGLGKAAASENLAKSLQGQGRFVEARQLLDSALQTRTNNGRGADHSTAAVLRKIAELELLRASSATSNGPAKQQMANKELSSALQTSREAVIVAERAYQTALSRSNSRRESNKESSRDDEGGNFLSKVFGFGGVSSLKPGKKIREVMASKSACPDLAALELAACLRTQASVQLVIGAVDQAAKGLQRALALVTDDWPGQAVELSSPPSGAAARSIRVGRIEDLRRDAVCEIVWASLRVFQSPELQDRSGNKEKMERLNSVRSQYGCPRT